jgi:hypothetical protein
VAAQGSCAVRGLRRRRQAGSGGKVAAPLVRDIIEDIIALDLARTPVFDPTHGRQVATGRPPGGAP